MSRQGTLAKDIRRAQALGVITSVILVLICCSSLLIVESYREQRDKATTMTRLIEEQVTSRFHEAKWVTAAGEQHKSGGVASMAREIIAGVVKSYPGRCMGGFYFIRSRQALYVSNSDKVQTQPDLDPPERYKLIKALHKGKTEYSSDWMPLKRIWVLECFRPVRIKGVLT